MPEPDLSEFHGLTEVEELRKTVTRLERNLRKARSKSEELREATREGMKDALLALGPMALVKAPQPDRRKKTPEVALWHLTDWQGAKVTATYNSDVMRERVLRYCDKAEKLTEIQRADHPVEDAVLMLGGDMGEGLFNFPQQPFEIDASIFGQFAFISRVEAEVVRRALGLYRNVTVVSEWGNHGRLGAKRSVIPRADNMDRMIHELARALLSDPETGRLPERLIWEDSDEDKQRVEVGNYRALLIHGDEVGRNGFAAPTTIVNHVAKWKSGAEPWAFRDCYLGHYHTHNEWALPDGEGAVFQTGSPESDNRYARDSMASAAKPSQRLHFVDPAAGRVTAQYRVDLLA